MFLPTESVVAGPPPGLGLPCLQAVQADVGRPADASDLLPPLPVGQLLVRQVLLDKVHGGQQAPHLRHDLLEEEQTPREHQSVSPPTRWGHFFLQDLNKTAANLSFNQLTV